MKILFITGHPYLPQMMGGMQHSADALITSLKQKGHQASILCALMPDGLLGKIDRVKIKLSKTKFAKDTLCGYPAYRSWFPWESVAGVVKQEQPDVIVVLTRLSVKMAVAAKQTGIPIVMMLQDVEFQDHGGDFNQLGNIECVANSAFTAEKYHHAFGVNPHVIHPLIFPEKYKTDPTHKYATFINLHTSKGLDIALAIAKSCTSIPFLFQESWPLSPSQWAILNKQIAGLSNVTLQRAVSDMRLVYQRTKILLVPSQWDEAYGRVVTEAHINGIPVIASNKGGLPEATGNAGILLDGDISLWAETVQKLWFDNAYYQTKVQDAFAESKLPQHDVEKQTDMWLKILTAVADGGDSK